MCCITETRRKCEGQKYGSNLRRYDSEAHYRVTIFVPHVERALSQKEARFTNQNKKSLFFGFLLAKLSGQKGVQEKLREVFDFYEPLFYPFTLQQAKEKIEVLSTKAIGKIG